MLSTIELTWGTELTPNPSPPNPETRLSFRRYPPTLSSPSPQPHSHPSPSRNPNPYSHPSPSPSPSPYSHPSPSPSPTRTVTLALALALTRTVTLVSPGQSWSGQDLRCCGLVVVEALGYTLTTAVLLLVVLYSLATGQDVVEALTSNTPERTDEVPSVLCLVLLRGTLSAAWCCLVLLSAAYTTSTCLTLLNIRTRSSSSSSVRPRICPTRWSKDMPQRYCLDELPLGELWHGAGE